MQTCVDSGRNYVINLFYFTNCKISFTVPLDNLYFSKKMVVKMESLLYNTKDFRWQKLKIFVTLILNIYFHTVLHFEQFQSKNL
jgi:hypothetical protein